MAVPWGRKGEVFAGLEFTPTRSRSGSVSRRLKFVSRDIKPVRSGSPGSAACYTNLSRLGIRRNTWHTGHEIRILH